MPDSEFQIDWEYFQTARNQSLSAEIESSSSRVLNNAYLLLPEMRAFLNLASIPDHYYLLNAMWHTGAMVSEIAALTPNDVVFDESAPYILLGNHSESGKSQNQRRSTASRKVPITDHVFMNEFNRYLKLKKRPKNAAIWPVTRQTVSRWTAANSKRFRNLHEEISFDITPHTIRFSFGVNAVLHLISLPILRDLLGHQRLESAAVYASVLDDDPFQGMKRVRF